MKIKPFVLERYFARYEFSVKYLLSCSDCEALTRKELLEMALPESLKLWENLKFSYTESPGHPVLREKICSLYETMQPEETLVAVPEEAIFLAMNALLKKGDHLVCISPAYQSLYEIAASIGCEVTNWQVVEGKGKWHLDLDALEKAMTPKTKMIVVNFPHNPTGYVPTPEEQEKMISLASDRGIYLFSDEMYRGLELEGITPLKGACDLYRNAITLSGLSKTYSLPGLRVGWLASKNRDVMSRIAALKDYTTICNSAPSEILGIMALENASSIAANNTELVSRNLAMAREFFAERWDRFTWFEPRGSSIAYPRLDLDMDVFEFCEGAVKSRNLMVVPSKALLDESNHFRIGLGRVNFPEALAVFGEYLKEL